MLVIVKQKRNETFEQRTHGMKIRNLSKNRAKDLLKDLPK